MDIDIPIDPALIDAPAPEAGPSRSAAVVPPSLPPPTDADAAMTGLPASAALPAVPALAEAAAKADSASEDVALLLGIGSTDPLPLAPTRIPLLEQSISPKDSTFPHTPPDETSLHAPAPLVTHPASSLSHVLEPQKDAPARSPSPANTPGSSSTGRKTTGKRKRNAQAGPSRAAIPEGKPAHWMGEDNTVIRCICGFEEDDGFTIQCEGCGAWEHGLCFGYIDEESAPDTYFCELCDPRPTDPQLAKARQLEVVRRTREAAAAESSPAENAPPKRGKKKRAKTANGPAVPAEAEAEGAAESSKAPNSGGTANSAPKPRRKVTAGGKPRSKPASTAQESTPGPAGTALTFKEPLPPVEIDDDYFTVEPWTMEYTPVPYNVVRGKKARRLLADFHTEWEDLTPEDYAVRGGRTDTNPSGLPSPTETGVLRLSPEAVLPGPDFNVLAPPIPPVLLSGADIDETLAEGTYVKALDDSPSFLPLNYAEVASSVVYGRPAIYGVFIEQQVYPGAFLGEFRGEVVDCESYRKDRINQYAQLGMTKAFVRSVGPPVNLIIDARGYGNDMRFIRSCCHPNAVLRPFLWRRAQGEMPKIKFGVFASRFVDQNEEITLGWEWDDQHVVHSLRAVIFSLLSSEADFGLSDSDISDILSKYEQVLTHLFGTFTSCACDNLPQCAVAQMRALVENREPLVDLVNGKVKLELGELVGAVRGWRTRENQEAELKRYDIPGDITTRRFFPPKAEIKVDHSPVRPAVDFAAIADQDEQMADVEDGEAGDESEDEPPVPSLVQRRRSAVGEDDGEDEDVSMSSSPARTPQVTPAHPLSSSLSSAPESKSQRVLHGNGADMEDDNGDVSDATSATVPRSDASEAEGSDSEADRPVATSSVASRKSVSPIKKRKVKSGSKAKADRASSGSKDATSTSTSSRPAQVRRPTGRKNRILSSPISDRESSPPARPSRSPVARTTRPLPMASATKSSPVKPGPRQLKEEPRAVAPDQVIAPMADAAELAPVEDDMAVDPVDALPAAVADTPARPATPPLDLPVQEEATTALPRAPTPPRESTPPREPTPEPPKKVSLSEYLQSLKMKKVETPAEGVVNGDEPGSMSAPPAASTEPAAEAPSAVATDSTVKAESSAPGQVNFLEFLPSSRGSVDATPLTPAAAAAALPSGSPVLTATPSSYVPRQDYFPPQQPSATQASSSYVPRQISSSYVPRPTPTPSDESPINPAVTPSYVPRQLSAEAPSPHVPRLTDDRLSSVTPPKYPSVSPDVHTCALPPVLPQRDLPPHAIAAGPGAGTPARNPPTGPRNPPTGPRGFPPPSPVNRPIELAGPGSGAVPPPMGNMHNLPPARSNFVPGPRYPGGRGGFNRGGGDRFEGDRPAFGPFRGRGGFRGRGRGG